MEFETAKESKPQFDIVRVEEGIYQGTLKEVKDISDGQYGARVAFIYNFKANDKDTQLALVCYKLVATPDNKLGQALMAHGVKIEEGKFDTDNLPQKTVRIFVEDYTRTVEEDGKKVEKKASIITKVKPLVENLAHNAPAE